MSEAQSALRSGRVSSAQAVAAAGVGVILTGMAFVLTPLQGRAGFLVIAYLAGVAAYLIAAARVEGRRSVVDRLAAVLMVTTVGVCLLGLGSVLVYTVARGKPPSLKSEIVEGMEGDYVSTAETPLDELARKAGKADLIVDATGSSQIAFDAMKALGHNGVLVWTSITGGNHSLDLPSDKINLDWVLGNKLLLGSVNANREHFESGIKDLALGEVMYPGVIQKILTTPVDGLDRYEEMMKLLVEDATALKVYVNVAKE